MPAPKLYSMEKRSAATADVVELGLAGAAKKHKMPKSTLHSWCVELGIATSTPEQRKTTEAATASSVMARRQKVAQSRERMTLYLATIAELGARAEIEMLNKAIAGKGETRLGEIVGARTRAIHDLALLSGDATERTELVDSVDDVMKLQMELRSRLGA